MQHVKTEFQWSYWRQIFQFLRDSLKFNISILEWYQFHFFDQSDSEKSNWAGTGTMYEFQLRANPKSARSVLADKREFYRRYRSFFRHELWSINELEGDSDLRRRILDAHDKLVFKDATGNCGTSVEIHSSSELNADSLVEWMRAHGFDVAEGFIEQHSDLMALSASAVNTVRVFTWIDEQERYHVLGCRLRISVNSEVDNLAAGNLAAAIDQETGCITGPAIYSDITKSVESVHPVTGVRIDGFQIPYWKETLDLIREASAHDIANRSIGWDVVITPDGPGLIEGNHDWCKLVWQLPVNQGLKARLTSS